MLGFSAIADEPIGGDSAASAEPTPDPVLPPEGGGTPGTSRRSYSRYTLAPAA